MTCDINTLLEDACANKFLCLSLQEQQAVLLQMLCNGVGGGTNGSGAPTTPPSGTFGFYYDYTNNVIYGWNPVSVAWVLIGSGSGGNSPVVYTNDPNTEALTPLNTGLPAVAYSSGGAGAIFGWNVAQQLWN